MENATDIDRGKTTKGRVPTAWYDDGKERTKTKAVRALAPMKLTNRRPRSVAPETPYGVSCVMTSPDSRSLYSESSLVWSPASASFAPSPERPPSAPLSPRCISSSSREHGEPIYLWVPIGTHRDNAYMGGYVSLWRAIQSHDVKSNMEQSLQDKATQDDDGEKGMTPQSPSFDARKARGQQIAQVESNVRRIDANEYRVRSQSGNGEYAVYSTESGWYCSCPDATTRSVKCKHIYAVELSLELRRRIENATRVVPLDFQSCLACGSDDIVKHGVRHNQSGDLQRYSCRACGKRFTKNLGFEGMGASPKAITGALQLYFTGESLRNVQKFLALQGVNVSHQTVHNWISKYVALMERYLDDITPKVGDKWRADELFLKVKGNVKWLYAMIDDESRYWLATQIGEKKWHEDVRPLWREAKAVAEKQPKTLITDGAENFRRANRKEYYSKWGAKNTVHIRDITFHNTPHNNLMERFNGELRDREKVMRGMKSAQSPILGGMKIFHNFVRPHEGLDGRTPAEAAGITVEGSNKWLTLIQNASHSKQAGSRLLTDIGDNGDFGDVPTLDSKKKSGSVPRI